MGLAAITTFIVIAFGPNSTEGYIEGVKYLLTSNEFYSALLVGMLAQTIDGALGMAYGVTSTTFLLGIGASPAAASGAVHTAETFTTGASGLSHLKYGNVDKKLFLKLVIPGVITSFLGAYLLSNIDGKLIKPYINVYLLIMGLIILSKGIWYKVKSTVDAKYPSLLAVVGAFLDSVGGGGWGPVVTTSLIGQGVDPKKTIGTVNTSEFFITIVSGITFLVLGGFHFGVYVAGLLIGGLFTAPIAAYMTSKVPNRVLLYLVGLLIITVSIFNIYKSFM